MLDIDKPDENGFVALWAASNEIGQQSQYVARYITGYSNAFPEVPKFDVGLRFDFSHMTGGNYHAIRIHEDDVDEFVRRVKAHHNHH